MDLLSFDTIFEIVKYLDINDHTCVLKLNRKFNNIYKNKSIAKYILKDKWNFTYTDTEVSHLFLSYLLTKSTCVKIDFFIINITILNEVYSRHYNINVKIKTVNVSQCNKLVHKVLYYNCPQNNTLFYISLMCSNAKPTDIYFM
jgi:hypothetical protein